MQFDNLPELVRASLFRIADGAIAADLENEALDFKEDPAVHPEARNPDGDLIATLRDTAICLVNGEGTAALAQPQLQGAASWLTDISGDSHIVLGVADKIAGAAAFTGTERATQWIEHKISQGTQPNLRVEAQDFIFQGARLVWIRIPAGLDFYTRPKGDATYRVGSNCMPATEDVRRAIKMRRLNPDFSALPASIAISDLSASALEQARKLLAARYAALGTGETAPQTDTALLRELNLLTTSGGVTKAAEVLFAAASHGRVGVRYFYRTVPGATPTVTELSDPAIFALQELSSLVRRHGLQELARVDLGSGQEVAIPAFPDQAVDEVIANAFAHRDWAMVAPIVVEQTPGTLSVVSPGGLPAGVSVKKLLTTHSVPRNPTLIGALRLLGLAEESSRGFDRMYAAMLQTGRDVPLVEAEESYVKVVLAAGKPDIAFVQGLAKLAKRVSHEVVYSVATLLVLKHLHHKPLITLNEVVERTETNVLEARELMELLANTEILRSVGGKLEQWMLSSDSSKAFGGESHRRIVHQPVEEWIKERLSAGEALTARGIADATGISRSEVTAVLRRMRGDGEVRIDPNGPERGSNTRWIAS